MMKMVYVLSAVILTSLLFSQYALAANEYYAGYPLKTNGDKFFQIIGSTRFNDSTILPTKTQGAVISTTGTTNTGSPFTANGMVYQSAVELRSTGAITGQPDVFRFEDANACFSEGPASIGTFGSNPEDTNYVYWVLAWDSGRTVILFYYENHKNNGNVSVPPEITYEKAVDCGGTDNSVNFLYGHKVISSTYKLKYLQFGIEGPLGMSTNGWKAREYSMTLYGTSDPGGIKSLSSLEARTTKYTSPVDNMNHSWVTQKGTQIRAVGGAPYTLDADYPAEGTATSGNVIWFYGGPLPVNTKLWP